MSFNWRKIIKIVYLYIFIFVYLYQEVAINEYVLITSWIWERAVMCHISNFSDSQLNLTPWLSPFPFTLLHYYPFRWSNDIFKVFTLTSILIYQKPSPRKLHNAFLVFSHWFHLRKDPGIKLGEKNTEHESNTNSDHVPNILLPQ